MKTLVIAIVVIYVHFLIGWCIYDDFKKKYVQAEKDFENSVTGQVILFKEGKNNGIIRYAKESD